MKLYIGVIIILSSSVLFNAQKLFLKNFEIVHYGATYKKHTILIDYYAKLEEDGNLLVCFKSFKNPGYYKYKLTNEEIKVLNSLKNKKITKYVEDTFRIDYADSFYLSYKFGNYSQKFTYGRDFMSKDFYNIMNIILNKIDLKNLKLILRDYRMRLSYRKKQMSNYMISFQRRRGIICLPLHKLS